MGYLSKKRFSTRDVVLMLTAVILGVGVFAYAAVTIPNTFSSGTTISSSAVNANFTSLANQMPGVDWVGINQTNINVTSAANVGTVAISAPTSGYAVVRFDGMAYLATSDSLTLAASATSASWGTNDGNVTLNSTTGLGQSFSHTRVYPISAAGTYTYYAVAHRYIGSGTGVASIYANLTVEFFPSRY